MTYSKYLELLNEAKDINTFAQENKLKLNTKNNLFILNYDEIACGSEKNWITHYSRGLVLTGEPGNYIPIAKSFNRFYNLQEEPPYLNKQEDINFDEDFIVEYKHDGSLILLYYYEGMWRVNTRGSFADGNVSSVTNKISKITWEKLFFDTFFSKYSRHILNYELDKGLTYCFELCTPYNQVVEYYENPAIYLLSAFNPKTGEEFFDLETPFERPQRYKVKSKEEIFDLLKTLPTTSEGFVLAQKDKELGIKRKKCKTETWAALAHNATSYNNPKSLWTIVFTGDIDEVSAIFPHLKDVLNEKKDYYKNLLKRCEEVFTLVNLIEDQKKFALEIQKNHKDIMGILFAARSKKSVKKEMVQNFILKNYKNINI